MKQIATIDIETGEVIDPDKPREVVALSVLRRELAEINSPSDALKVRSKAERMREAFKLMNKSVEECNEVAEIYLQATWKFGDLVRDVPVGAPEGNQNARR